MRYWILKEAEDNFIWDEKENVMYEFTEDFVQPIKPSLEQLQRFRPYLELVRKTDKRPKSLDKF